MERMRHDTYIWFKRTCVSKQEISRLAVKREAFNILVKSGFEFYFRKFLIEFKCPTVKKNLNYVTVIGYFIITSRRLRDASFKCLLNLETFNVAFKLRKMLLIGEISLISTCFYSENLNSNSYQSTRICSCKLTFYTTSIVASTISALVLENY